MKISFLNFQSASKLAKQAIKTGNQEKIDRAVSKLGSEIKKLENERKQYKVGADAWRQDRTSQCRTRESQKAMNRNQEAYTEYDALGTRIKKRESLRDKLIGINSKSLNELAKPYGVGFNPETGRAYDLESGKKIPAGRFHSVRFADSNGGRRG